MNANSDNAPMPYAGACGWQTRWLYQGEPGQMRDWDIPANSKRVGYVNLNDQLVYLIPEMAKTVARTMGREQGESFENLASIGRDLADAKLIITTIEDGKVRNTIQKRLPHQGK